MSTRSAAWSLVSPTRPDPELRQLGRRIRKLREEAGISQEALADAAGIHRTYMSAIERGVSNPSYTILLRLAGALRVRLARLLED